LGVLECVYESRWDDVLWRVGGCDAEDRLVELPCPPALDTDEEKG